MGAGRGWGGAPDGHSAGSLAPSAFVSLFYFSCLSQFWGEGLVLSFVLCVSLHFSFPLCLSHLSLHFSFLCVSAPLCPFLSPLLCPLPQALPSTSPRPSPPFPPGPLSIPVRQAEWGWQQRGRCSLGSVPAPARAAPDLRLCLLYLGLQLPLIFWLQDTRLGLGQPGAKDVRWLGGQAGGR